MNEEKQEYWNDGFLNLRISSKTVRPELVEGNKG